MALTSTKKKKTNLQLQNNTNQNIASPTYGNINSNANREQNLGGNKITNNSQSTGTTTSQKTPSYSDAYKDYVNQLESQKVNANNEIAIAEQNTQKYLDNYLKAQGLYGSGMGASLGMGNINQANQLRQQTTQSFNQALNEYKTDYNTQQQEQAITNIDAMVNSGKTKEEIENYLSTYQNDAGLTSSTQKYIQDYLNNISGATSWQDDRKNNVNDIATAITQLEDGDLKTKLKDIARRMNSATSQEEYNKLLQEYDDLVLSTSLGGKTPEEVINETTFDEALSSVQEKYKKLIENAKTNSEKVKLYNDYLKEIGLGK